ncbi:MAG: protoglobin domain-containing protein [Planctomycetes bacterium]|nr:protoglobin domain-containing protein [Planctomycetota bacterium]
MIEVRSRAADLLQGVPEGRRLTEAEVRERLGFLCITDADLDLVRRAGPVLEELAERFAGLFYEHLQRYPASAALIRGRVDALRVTQAEYFRQLAAGNVDAAYVESRAQVGRTHERLGMPLKWYTGAFCFYIQAIGGFLQEEPVRTRLGVDALGAWELAGALTKLVFFDMSIANDVYIDALVETTRNQEAALRELSAPVIEVWERTLVLPLVGTMDTHRAQDVTESLLTAVMERRARVVILDITGLPVMDTSTANHIFKAIRAVELLGATAIVTGIRPAIAQTVVSLGIDTAQLRTQARLVDGLRSALELLGQRVVEAPRGGAEAARPLGERMRDEVDGRPA